jgi:hypothetical protein
VEIVSTSMNLMSVALGGSALDVSTMTPLAILAEHNRLSPLYQAQFKAGGVGAVDAADVPVEPVKIDPLYRQRLASVRSIAKAH